VGFSLDLTVVKDTYVVLLGSVAYGLIVTLSIGTLILAMSSLTRRSLYVGIAWAGLWIISGAVGSIMSSVYAQSVRNGVFREELNVWMEKNPPPPGIEVYGRSFRLEHTRAKRNRRSGEMMSDEELARMRWQEAYGQATNKAFQEGLLRQGEAMREDWRPCFSYVANLSRMADLLLDTDTAWVAMGKASANQGPRGQGDGRMYADRMVAQYPWWWSAAVLAGLLGLSTWIMTRRVKSLDRLK
jgi:ABC-2 type transport system permease protein